MTLHAGFLASPILKVVQPDLSITTHAGKQRVYTGKQQTEDTVIQITIIDCRMGNLNSVYNAFKAIDQPARIISDPVDLRHADSIVLPGVGAFGDAMSKLQSGNWVEALTEEIIANRKPFLGICVGMQVLATIGTEHGQHTGLNWIGGIVDRMQPEEEHYRIPHIGWNEVVFTKHAGLFQYLGDKADFYFVHSYAHFPEDPSVISGITDHGMRFAAAFEKENIYATQFHPEKSQKSGLKVLQNFVTLAERQYA